MLKVHNDILAKIIRAPINLFFDITPTGLILNRFNNDMRCFEHVVHQLVGGVYQGGHLVLVLYTLAKADIYILLLVPFMLAYQVYIYRFTIGSMREIHRILSVARTPIHQHYNEIMSGNSTIRAFKTQKYSIDRDFELNNFALLTE